MQLSKVLDSLRETHPRHTFVNFNDAGTSSTRKRTRKETPKAYSALLHMLIKKEIDIAIADARELPLRPQSNVSLSAVPARSNPFDVLISNEGIILDDQPEKARLAGINSVRRGQLLFYRPDLHLVEEIGEFEKLYKKLQRREIEGFVFAASDVEVLNEQDKVVEVFTSSICMPVAGQGALELLTRSDDKEAKSVVKVLNDPSSAAEVEVERLFLKCISRDGRGPIGVLANVEGTGFRIEAAIASPDGLDKVRGAINGQVGDESDVIEKFAEELLQSGGRQIIKAFKKSSRQ